MMYFNNGTGGFYNDKLGGVPVGSVKLTDDDYQELLLLVEAGKKITIDSNGSIIGVDPEPPAPPTREEVEAMRLRAYADAVTGSDRYFSEAARMQIMGDEGWEQVRDQGISRYAEIQNDLAWPQ
ncbi:hypothetical protein [Pseudomonas frederiksbergensis]|uniref:Phage tail protein n=1 Tax=Pseudomonas frederiksbergensis TaxID=104087 RepID=A0A0U1PR60_9PSED|nr:hypothetical protein [Pseudomonas frederiksbergensis]KKK07892.1 hypothetical protein JZ00_31300 [Pseudomonas frederiksbergensis]